MKKATPLGRRGRTGAPPAPATHRGISLGPNSPLRAPADPTRTIGARSRPLQVGFKNRDTEHLEQAALFRRARSEAERRLRPQLRELYAIPNGATLPAKMVPGPNGPRRVSKVADKLKAEGLEEGTPDTHLPLGRKGTAADGAPVLFHSLYLEMKAEGLTAGPKVGTVRITAGSCSAEQKDRIKRLLANGNAVAVCWNAEEAWQALTAYIDGLHRQRPDPCSRRNRDPQPPTAR